MLNWLRRFVRGGVGQSTLQASARREDTESTVRPINHEGVPSRVAELESRSNETGVGLVTDESPVQRKSSRFSKPRILLLDLGDEEDRALREAGFSVEVGSFGRSYEVQAQSAFRPVVLTHHLPSGYGESELVVIDLADNLPIENGPVGIVPVENKVYWWASCEDGVVDPRLVTMRLIRDRFDRMLQHGGVFVVFGERRWNPPFRNTSYSRNYGFASDKKEYLSNWGFLSTFEGLRVNGDNGTEIGPSEVKVEAIKPLSRLLQRYLPGCTYTCTYDAAQPGSWMRPEKHRWMSLAKNKFGKDVAALIGPDEQEPGLVVLLPRLDKQHSFLKELVSDVLPDLVPNIFPEHQSVRWQSLPEYQTPRVLGLAAAIDKARQEYEEAVRLLEEEIETERASTEHLTQLLTETDAALVTAVKVTLEKLGFDDVQDADSLSTDGVLREDLQVFCDDKVLLVEIKGIHGSKPKDEDVLAVSKYYAPFMKRTLNVQVSGLSIVNHHRAFAPLDRESNPFRQDVIDASERDEIGLLTSWDLFRLARGTVQNGWLPEHVRPVLFGKGRIEPIPTHYQYVGRVEGFIEKYSVVGIRIETADISVGDRIAFEAPVDFVEQDVDSLQINNAPVRSATIGDHPGLLTRLSKKQARDGVRVFRVRRNV